MGVGEHHLTVSPARPTGRGNGISLNKHIHINYFLPLLFRNFIGPPYAAYQLFENPILPAKRESLKAGLHKNEAAFYVSTLFAPLRLCG